jgi:hypothetical protein
MTTQTAPIRTVSFNGETYRVARKAAKFVSFYKKGDDILTVEHTSEKAAQKGSWQSASMKLVWIYQGYATI